MASDDTALPARPYDGLEPDVILAAIESLELATSGHLLALNSYENRVYQIGIEDDSFLVAKFYRPGRWSDAAIEEEHAFTLELAEREIPVVAPLVIGGATLFRHGGFRFAVYPRRGGRPPELDSRDNLQWLGRFIGRIHAVGAASAFVHRPRLTPDTFGHDSYRHLLDSGFIPPELAYNYRDAAQRALEAIDQTFADLAPLRHIRLHGDCHVGNVLWTDRGPHFVDFDDSRMGPAVQDLWMLLSGDREDMSRQLSAVLAGYTEFHDFDPAELGLIEALRTLRQLHYSAWLARRWQDPAFPMSFPWFNTPRYWEEQLMMLREQAERMHEPPPRWR